MKRLCLFFCFVFLSLGFADSTVDMLQQRANEGDVTAQTVLGLMHQYGYRFPRDYNEAAKWYKLSADQNDFFSDQQLQLLDRISDGRIKSKTDYGKSAYDRIMQKASVAEREGDVSVEELVREASELKGMVVKLRCYGGSYYSTSRSRNQMSLYGNDFDLYVSVNLPPENSDAHDWAIERDKRDGALDSVYVYVDETDRLYLLGTKKKKNGDGYLYRW